MLREDELEVVGITKDQTISKEEKDVALSNAELTLTKARTSYTAVLCKLASQPDSSPHRRGAAGLRFQSACPPAVTAAQATCCFNAEGTRTRSEPRGGRCPSDRCRGRPDLCD
eukprot:748309-Hanusia_phi.AAC.14